MTGKDLGWKAAPTVDIWWGLCEVERITTFAPPELTHYSLRTRSGHQWNISIELADKINKVIDNADIAELLTSPAWYLRARGEYRNELRRET